MSLSEREQRATIHSREPRTTKNFAGVERAAGARKQKIRKTLQLLFLLGGVFTTSSFHTSTGWSSSFRDVSDRQTTDNFVFDDVTKNTQCFVF